MISKNKKFSLKLHMAYLLILMLISSTGLAEGTFTDVKGHWAEENISTCVENGLVRGYADGSFKPNASITRAEFMVLINRAHGFTKKAPVSFSDVSTANWYYDDVAKAIEAGYIAGYEDQTVRPNNPISRQEVAVILSRLLDLQITTGQSSIVGFNDFSSIPNWSKGAVNAVVADGYMRGYPDETFMPNNPTSRAETVVILDRALGELYNEAGTYGPETGTETISSNVTVTANGVKLQNMLIKGDLFLTAGIGDGDIHIVNVTVEGRTVITGGGADSIIFQDSSLGIVITQKADGSIRVVFEGSSSAADVVFKSGGKIEVTSEDGSVAAVTIASQSQIELSGNFTSVTIEESGSQVNLSSGTIENLTVSKTAVGSTINVSEDASITTLVINAPVSVTGSGKIGTAVVNSDGVTIEQTPDTVEVGEEVSSVEVAGEEVTETTEFTTTTPVSIGGTTTTATEAEAAVAVIAAAPKPELSVAWDTDEATTQAAALAAVKAHYEGNTTDVTITVDWNLAAPAVTDAVVAATDYGFDLDIVGDNDATTESMIDVTIQITFLAAPAVDSIVVAGETTITIPGSDSQTSAYIATVKDQYGDPMVGDKVNWSVEDVDGTDVASGAALINADTGVVTVSDAASAQVNSFKVVATSDTDPAVIGEFNVTLVEVTVSALDFNYYAAGDTLTFTISGLRLNEEDVIVHMPIQLIEEGVASDLLVLEEMLDDDGVTYMQGNVDNEGNLEISGTLSAGLPAGILHITLPGYGYTNTIDQRIQLQDDQGTGVRVGPLTVTFSEDYELENVSILVYSDETRTEAVGDPVTTDGPGVATKDLVNGNYWFRATLAGYHDFEGSFEVSGEAKTVDFEMVVDANVVNTTQNTGFDTIQAAIDVAEEGDTILVGAGTHYVPQIVIDKDLTIEGAGKSETIIKPAEDTGGSGDDRGWFLVEAGNEFNLSNVTLDGDGKNVHQAIRSHGSGTIDNNIIKNIKYSQHIGLGMVGMVGSNMTFSNNTFTNIERIGMMAFGTGTTAEMISNTYIGKGQGDWIDYGIEIGGGATATITGNAITDCGPSTLTGWASAGISVNSLYADPGEVSSAVITGNTLTNNEIGIFVGYPDDAPDHVVVNSNNISGNSVWGLLSNTEVPIDATDNWWGHDSGPYHETKNPYGDGDAVSDNVVFDPWADSPF